MFKLGKVCCTRWYQHMVSLHYVIALCVWLSVVSLQVTFLLRNGKGYIIALRSLNEIDAQSLWLHMCPLFQCAVVLQALTSVYTLLEDNYKGGKHFLIFEQVVRVYSVYFVAIPALKEGVLLRSLLIVLNSWTLLNIFRCLKAIYTLQFVENIFVEWCCHKLFLLLYPLITFAEVNLVRSASKILKDMPAMRSYPSPMPNMYNFNCDLYVIYVCLPFVMVPCSVFYYIYKLQNRKLKYF